MADGGVAIAAFITGAELEVATCHKCSSLANYWKTRRVCDLRAATMIPHLVQSPCAAGWSRDLSSLPLGFPGKRRAGIAKTSPSLFFFLLLC